MFIVSRLIYGLLKVLVISVPVDFVDRTSRSVDAQLTSERNRIFHFQLLYIALYIFRRRTIPFQLTTKAIRFD